MITTSGIWDRYEQGFNDFVESANDDRQLIAAILLDAVEQSFQSREYKARRWLNGIYAQSLFILLDISPTAAMEHLSRKWERIDSNVPPPGHTVH